MKKIFIILFVSINLLLYSLDLPEIDWGKGRLYSSVTVKIKADNNFAANRLTAIANGYEKAKANFYEILKKINISESTSLLKYFENRGDKNRELFTLIDKSNLFKIEYPDLNSIKLSYYINIYGEPSLMSILMDDRSAYAEDLISYMGYNYNTEYTGVIIDARGELTSFDGYKVKVKPSLFIVIRDSDGRIILDQSNVSPEIIKLKGMVRYSFDVNEKQTERVGEKPLFIEAYGAGDRAGSNIVVSVTDAKKMVSSEIIRNAIQNGKIVVIIDP